MSKYKKPSLSKENISLDIVEYNNSIQELNGCSCLFKGHLIGLTIFNSKSLENNANISDSHNDITIYSIDITDNQKTTLFSKVITYENMVFMRNRLGFEGKWSVLFENIKSSIKSRSLEIIVHQQVSGDGDENIDSNKSIELIVFFNISTDIKLKFEFVLSIHDSTVTKEYFLVCLLVNSQKKIDAIEEKEGLSSKSQDNYYINECKNGKESKVKVEIKNKRRFVSDLVNPNAKKRRFEGGVKFKSSISSASEDEGL